MADVYNETAALTSLRLIHIVWRDVGEKPPEGAGARPATPEETLRAHEYEDGWWRSTIDKYLVVTTRKKRSKEWRRLRRDLLGSLCHAREESMRHRKMVAWVEVVEVKLADWVDDSLYGTVTFARKPTYMGHKVRHWRRHHGPRLVPTPTLPEDV